MPQGGAASRGKRTGVRHTTPCDLIDAPTRPRESEDPFFACGPPATNARSSRFETPLARDPTYGCREESAAQIGGPGRDVARTGPPADRPFDLPSAQRGLGRAPASPPPGASAAPGHGILEAKGPPTLGESFSRLARLKRKRAAAGPSLQGRALGCGDAAHARAPRRRWGRVGAGGRFVAADFGTAGPCSFRRGAAQRVVEPQIHKSLLST